ncbi:MAG: DNA-processing protein DprA [Atopobiaceae bacterium]|jgi:DNA processing protein
MSATWEIKQSDGEYPAQLLEIKERLPETLFGVGDKEVLNTPCISVIGARRATPYGMTVAGMAGRVAAQCGITVVSGGACGCDYAASRSALDAGGRTIIVSGCGADMIYPRSSQDIFHDAVRSGGAVISLRPWGKTPRRYAFIQRNAVIATLSKVLFVTEAGVKSGTMSTAEVATELGREVYAVPGSIFSPNSAGTNQLIADGASIITSEMDLEVRISLDYDRLRLISENGSRKTTRLVSALIASPMRPDELATLLGEPLLTLIKTLSEYETQGVVERLPDGRYSASETTYRTYCKR